MNIFIPKNRAFGQQQLKRSAKQLIDTQANEMAYVASAEDTILAKLEWYRLGGEVSERQKRDVQGILEISGEKLDKSYLRHWARKFTAEAAKGAAFLNFVFLCALRGEYFSLWFRLVRVGILPG